jgi:hypothetical protein
VERVSLAVVGRAPRRPARLAPTLAAATQLYLRYDGEIGSGTDNHALNVGVRFTW